jgi:hypothetical protein
LLRFAFFRIDSRTESAGFVARKGAGIGRRKHRLRHRSGGVKGTPGGTNTSWSRRLGNSAASRSSAAPAKRSSVASHTWYSACCAPTWQSAVPSRLTARSKRPLSVASVNPATTTGAKPARYTRYHVSANGAS